MAVVRVGMSFLSGGFPWPARSPDLSAFDYFLRGTSKRRYSPIDYTTVQELKVAVEHEMTAIAHDATRRSLDNFKTKRQ
jgi:hypothetical protein